MSDVANSEQKIQEESIQSTTAVSESSLFAIGGAINYCLSNTGKVGDVVMSALDESTFQAQRDTTWVLCDGRNVAGSEYQALTSLANIPDFRGNYFRGKNNGAGRDPHGELPIGDVYNDQFASHGHGLTDPGHAHGVPNVDFGGGPTQSLLNGLGNVHANYPTAASATGISLANSGGSETNPKTVIINAFVKINP